MTAYGLHGAAAMNAPEMARYSIGESAAARAGSLHPTLARNGARKTGRLRAVCAQESSQHPPCADSQRIKDECVTF